MTLLSVKGLGKSFGGVRAVDGIDFDIAPGELLALIGPNGAGKSTTFNMVNGQLRADRGSILLEGTELIGLQPRQLDQGSFEVAYSFSCRGQTAARGLTRHRAITIEDRQGCALPAVINAWLEACQPSTVILANRDNPQQA